MQQRWRQQAVTVESRLDKLKDTRVGQVYTDKIARTDDEPYTYDGMGVLIGIRK